jgi:hypothetical protein
MDKVILRQSDEILDLLDEIKREIECIETDFLETLEVDQRRQVPKDLVKIEKHLRATAKLFSHLTGFNSPDWGQGS